METILITGGAGFIGSNVVAKLLVDGYKVICVDNFDPTYDVTFKESNIKPFIDNPNFILERVDICDAPALKSIFTKYMPKYVIHLAAKADTRDAVETPHIYMTANITGTLNVLECSKDFKISNLVIASSSSVYGNTLETPWREDMLADRPLSPYGATKRAGEVLAYSYHHNFDLNITCLRYFNVYGENNRPNMVPYKWAEAILKNKEIEISGDGSRKRDYTYIGDIVEGTLLAMKKPLGFEVLNLGNTNPISLNELLAVFEKKIGTKASVKSRPIKRRIY
jgi:UDP-glucuronate 4-epimerase